MNVHTSCTHFRHYPSYLAIAAAGLPHAFLCHWHGDRCWSDKLNELGIRGEAAEALVCAFRMLQRSEREAKLFDLRSDRYLNLGFIRRVAGHLQTRTCNPRSRNEFVRFLLALTAAGRPGFAPAAPPSAEEEAAAQEVARRASAAEEEAAAEAEAAAWAGGDSSDSSIDSETDNMPLSRRQERERQRRRPATSASARATPSSAAAASSSGGATSSARATSSQGADAVGWLRWSRTLACVIRHQREFTANLGARV